MTVKIETFIKAKAILTDLLPQLNLEFATMKTLWDISSHVRVMAFKHGDDAVVVKEFRIQYREDYNNGLPR